MPQAQGKISSPRRAPQNLRERENLEAKKKYEVEEETEEEFEKDNFSEEIQETHDDFLDKEETPSINLPQTFAPSTNRSSKSETLTKVEKILEKDLGDIYFKMPEEAKQKFKVKGEEISLKIEEMIEAGKAIARKILTLIKVWLQTIPGVNRFFLEQEAKIKTDKIMEYVEREKKI